MGKEVWTFAEQHGGQVESVSFELLTRGRKLADRRGASLASILLGYTIDPDGLNEFFERGADKIYLVENQKLAYYLNDLYANVLTYLITTYEPEIILAGATTTGRSVLPYVAARVHTGLTADCTELEIEEDTGNLLQTRPAIGGNIMATIKTPNHRPQMATVRPKSTPMPPPEKGRTGQIIRVHVPEDLLKGREERLGFRGLDLDDAGIQNADRIVSGLTQNGRGFILLIRK